MASDSNVPQNLITADVTIKQEVETDEPDYPLDTESAENYTEDLKLFSEECEPKCEPDPEIVQQILIIKYENQTETPKKTTKRVFQCPDCELTLANKNSLARHQWRIHNPDRKIAKRGRPQLQPLDFQCKYCDRSFSKENSLKSHEFTHRSIPVAKLLPQIAAGVILQKNAGTLTPKNPETSSKTVNVRNTKAVNIVLGGKSAQVKLTKLKSSN